MEVLKAGNVVYVLDGKGRHAVRITAVLLETGVYQGEVVFSDTREKDEPISFNHGQFKGHYLGAI